MREIKFQAWDMADRDYWEPKGMVYFDLYNIPEFIAYTFCPKDSDRFVQRFRVMQYTGLKDKDNFQEIYEYDIINAKGEKVGNYYENKNLLEDRTNHLIARMGTKEWCNSEQEAIKRGCKYAE